MESLNENFTICFSVISKMCCSAHLGGFYLFDCTVILLHCNVLLYLTAEIMGAVSFQATNDGENVSICNGNTATSSHCH